MAGIQALTLRGNNRVLLLIALVAGLIAAAVVFIALSEGDGDGGGSAISGATTPVVVAAADIPVGTAITEEMLRLSDMPEDLVISGVLTETTPAVGEVARVTIAAGEQITGGKLGVPVPDKGLAGVVPAGMRAVGLEVSEVTAVGGLLLPGDHVDILVAREVTSNTLRTEIILQNVEVLAVAQEAQDASARPQTTDGSDASYTSGQLPDDVEEQPDAGTLTLALTPEQAQTLISFHDNDDVRNIWAVLRSYGDQTIIEGLPPYEINLVDENQ